MGEENWMDGRSGLGCMGAMREYYNFGGQMSQPFVAFIIWPCSPSAAASVDSLGVDFETKKMEMERRMARRMEDGTNPIGPKATANFPFLVDWKSGKWQGEGYIEN